MSDNYQSGNPSNYEGQLIKRNYELTEALKWCVSKLQCIDEPMEDCNDKKRLGEIKSLIKFGL